MKKILLIIACIFLCGCLTTKPRPNPVLTSKEESWYIPKGTEFQAKKKPTEPTITVKAEDDLMVLYFGKYLELEKQANSCSQ